MGTATGARRGSVWRGNTGSNAWDRDEVLGPTSDADRGSHGDDTIFAYLKEMGSIPLLTAKQETEVASRLAKGRERIADHLYRCPLAVGELLSWGPRLQVGEIRIREIARLDAKATSGVHAGDWFRIQLGTIARLDQRARRLWRRWRQVVRDGDPGFRELLGLARVRRAIAGRIREAGTEGGSAGPPGQVAQDLSGTDLWILSKRARSSGRVPRWRTRPDIGNYAPNWSSGSSPGA